MLEPVAEKVTFVHRRDTFRAHEYSVQKMKNSGVHVLTSREILAIHRRDGIEKVVVGDKKQAQTEELEVDDVIVSFGFVSSLGPIKIGDWRLRRGRYGQLPDGDQHAGVYAAGDITTYPGKVKLIAVGFGEAPTAVNNAKQYIDPKARLQPGHSSNMKF